MITDVSKNNIFYFVSNQIMIIFASILIYKIMSAVFLKVENESYELVDKETGEVTELYETIKVDEEIWFKLYVNTFFGAIGNITSLKDLKVFILCLKLSVDRKDEGNIINVTDIKFKSIATEQLKLNKQNLWRSLNSLCEKGFLHKIDKNNYRINPQISYCGSRHDRAKLILKIIHEPTDKILSDTKE